MHMKKKFKEEESIEILKILGVINNMEEYQKIHNHASLHEIPYFLFPNVLKRWSFQKNCT